MDGFLKLINVMTLFFSGFSFIGHMSIIFAGIGDGQNVVIALVCGIIFVLTYPAVFKQKESVSNDRD